MATSDQIIRQRARAAILAHGASRPWGRPSVPRSSAVTDLTLAVLARTAAAWFAPSLEQHLCVSAMHGRIRLEGHIDNARPLVALKTVLTRLPGVMGLDQLITVEPLRKAAPEAFIAHV